MIAAPKFLETGKIHQRNMERKREMTMKNLLLLFLLACALPAFPADGVPHDEIIKQYRNGNFEDIPEHAEGQIDGEDYVVMLVTQTYPPQTLLFKKTADQFEAIAEFDSDFGAGMHYRFEIRDDSLFLYFEYGHHGVHGTRYQFRRIQQAFRMVGAEHMYTGVTYCPSKELLTCNWRDEFSGTRYDFLTSSALCWKKSFSLDHDKNEKQYEETSRRTEAWLLPKGGLKHKMTFRRMTLPLLDGFDHYEFSLPQACYFDHKGRLHIERPRRQMKR
jgi:hypothetical protein